MARDREREANNMARSIVLNTSRGFHCDCISKGVAVPGLTPDSEGYYTVSYHMAGMQAAWVMQSRLRKSYPNLLTRVVNVADTGVEWAAEVRVKRLTETEA